MTEKLLYSSYGKEKSVVLVRGSKKWEGGGIKFSS